MKSKFVQIDQDFDELGFRPKSMGLWPGTCVILTKWHPSHAIGYEFKQGSRKSEDFGQKDKSNSLYGILRGYIIITIKGIHTLDPSTDGGVNWIG